MKENVKSSKNWHLLLLNFSPLLLNFSFLKPDGVSQTNFEISVKASKVLMHPRILSLLVTPMQRLFFVIPKRCDLICFY